MQDVLSTFNIGESTAILFEKKIHYPNTGINDESYFHFDFEWYTPQIKNSMNSNKKLLNHNDNMKFVKLIFSKESTFK